MAYNMIKKEATQLPIAPIDKSQLQYFASNIFNADFYADVIFNIDIKAAYATVLLNDGFISSNTYNYIMRLPKMDRLAAVGMLAGKKAIFSIDESGKIISHTETVSPTADYFFYCVKKTFDIMSEAEKVIGNDAFLFSWVDGIYFLDDEKSALQTGARVKDFFAKNNFAVSYERLENFSITNKRDFYECSYLKDGKQKLMNVPKPDNSTLKKIYEHLIKKEY